MEDIELTPDVTRQAEQAIRRPTARILVGCGILQLPAWGFAMTFGIFQQAYAQHASVRGSGAGVIGTTMNGVMYLSMPFLSTYLEKDRWAPWQRAVAIAGTALAAGAFLISSWATEIWQLVVLQGVLAAFGCAMLYTPTTLWVNEWFRGGNRSTAYGVQFSVKNIVGTSVPFLMFGLLQDLGYPDTIRVWACILFTSAIAGLVLVPVPPSGYRRRTQTVPWNFLRHRTFYIYAFANMVFSSGYGLPQTYLSAYAAQFLRLPAVESAAMIAFFNAPGILSCVGFGLLSDKVHLGASTSTLISAGGSAVCVFLLWGLKSHIVPALLILFAMTYGFFASGYSSTWGGWISDMELEAAANNEVVNSGMLYGLLNGARGVGYVIGGVSGVELLDAGPVASSRNWAYGTSYGSLILFTGISSAIGGWSILWGLDPQGTKAIRRRLIASQS